MCLFKVIEHKKYNCRQEFDDAVHDELKSAQIEIVCLAGFMRILSGKYLKM